MAAPRKKPPVKKPPVKKAPIKKKPSFLRKDTPRPARDVKPGDLRSQASQGPKKTGVKSPAETRRSISRKQTGTSRPARGVEPGGLRDKALKEAQANARSATTTKPSKAGLLRAFGARAVGAIGAIVDPSFMSNEYGGAAGPGSDKPVGSVMKSNMPGGYGSKTSGYGPTPTKKTSGFGKRISEGAKFERLRASRAALADKSSGTTQNRPTTTRPKPMNTLAADYAAKQQGQAKAKNVAPKPTPKPRPVASSAPVKKVGRLTRYEREGLPTDRMQRKPKGNLLDFLKKRK